MAMVFSLLSEQTEQDGKLRIDNPEKLCYNNAKRQIYR